MRASERGFTLIELLVIVSILALLMAITIPAVQSGRESARRLQCANHLKQIGIALAQHEAHYTYYPPGRTMRWQISPGARFKMAFPSPRQGFYDLLPFLEEMPLYNSFNTAIDLADEIQVDLVLNMTAGAVPVGTLLCPSDGGHSSVYPGKSSYRFNVGDRSWLGRSSGSDYLDEAAAFVILRNNYARQFTDGLSNTMGVSERLLGSGASSARQLDRTRDLWFGGVIDVFKPTTADEVLQFCTGLHGTPLEFDSQLGRSWDESSFIATWYNHIAPPNSSIMDCTLDIQAGYRGVYTALSARSAHSGGVLALMMDGSVHTAKSSINLAVWRALGTRAGGEPLGNNAY